MDMFYDIIPSAIIGHGIGMEVIPISIDSEEFEVDFNDFSNENNRNDYYCSIFFNYVNPNDNFKIKKITIYGLGKNNDLKITIPYMAKEFLTVKIVGNVKGEIVLIYDV